MDVIKTKRWTVDKNVDIHNTCPQIQEAAMWINKNEVVAFPTETVYGLGANIYSDEAVDKIFKAKGRPSDNPLIVHIANIDQLHALVKEIPPLAKKLIDVFWPGPLTLVLKKGSNISRLVTANLSTVAVRMPSHPVALAIINAAGVPVAAPSANVSGKPSPTLADHVEEDLSGRIKGIVDGGATGVGVESTVLDCTTEIPQILRPGGVTREQLEDVIGVVTVDPALEDEGQAPKSPGLKYKHYAPKAKLFLVEGGSLFLQGLANHDRQVGKKVGILTTAENVSSYKANVVLPCGSKTDLRAVAQHLYEVLREFDKHDLDVIYSETFPDSGVGKAVMNRLQKAAGGDIIYEHNE